MKLAVIIALLFSGMNATVPQTDPCDNLKVTAEVKHTTDGLDNGEVEVKVEGGVEPYVYVFAEEDGRPVTFNFKVKSVSSLGSGKYTCTVYDNNACRKTIEFTIINE